MNIKNAIEQFKLKLLDFKHINFYITGRSFYKNKYYLDGKFKNELELKKTPSRTEIINYILSRFKNETYYLEIGVRDPNDNFNLIKADIKYSVDPGFEFEENPVDFKMTSDDFFKGLKEGKFLKPDVKFDVIFIDGLHLAEQVDKDIFNALNYIKKDGFIILHDCNPPTEWHSRVANGYFMTPASQFWNGTSWKAFIKWRLNTTLFSCCIDSDWGVGILSKGQNVGEYLVDDNKFYYDYSVFDANRKEFLNLIDFEKFKKYVK